MTTAMNRLRYDACEYSKSLHQSVAPIDYVLDTSKYVNCGMCRNQLGLVGGTAVSHVSGDLVEAESDLLNIRRPATRCPEYMYRPVPAGQCIVTPHDDIPGRGPNAPIPTDMRHLRPCQMVAYPQVPQPQQGPPFSCPN